MSSATKNANNMYHVYASLHQEEMAVEIFTQKKIINLKVTKTYIVLIGIQKSAIMMNIYI